MTMNGMRNPLWLLIVFLVATSAGAATSSPLPKGVKLPRDVAVPNDTVLAVYLPESERSSRSYLRSVGLWVEPGKALDDARHAVGERLFQKILPVDLDTPSADLYGLLLTIQPRWKLDSGKLTLTMKFRIYGSDSKQLHASEVAQSAPFDINNPATTFSAIALKTMQSAMIQVLQLAAPSAAKYPATASLAGINYELLINRDQPVTTGTGFYINKAGQLLTAAHVVRNCVLIEAQIGDRKLRVTRHSYSDLLDLAVVDTGEPSDKSIPLRIGTQLTLGEPVTNVGFPLAGLLAGSPNLTRGNVSARGGLKGSMGIFQFSAPIQPGSSGGPVVSDGGELLGVTVSTLNASALITAGLLPQNVNFALDAHYAAMFLRKQNVQFDEVAPNTHGNMQTANDAALGAVVMLSCYQ